MMKANLTHFHFIPTRFFKSHGFLIQTGGERVPRGGAHCGHRGGFGSRMVSQPIPLPLPQRQHLAFDDPNRLDHGRLAQRLFVVVLSTYQENQIG